ncbi:MAG: SCO family protein [Pseudomonadota bacterium]
MKKLLLVFVPILFLLLIWMVFFWSPEKNHSVLSSAQQPMGGEFTLESATGKIALKDFRNKIVLIYFGYTWCPDICPTNLAMMSAAFTQLNEQEAQQVQGLFISVDPDRDSVKRLSSYTEFFHKKIMGLTGSKKQINELSKRYGVSYRLVKQDSATDYVVDHSSETYVVGKQGQLLEKIPHASPPEQILLTIRKYL